MCVSVWDECVNRHVCMYTCAHAPGCMCVCAHVHASVAGTQGPD